MFDDYPPAKVDSGERYHLMAVDLSEFVSSATGIHRDLLFGRPDDPLEPEEVREALEWWTGANAPALKTMNVIETKLSSDAVLRAVSGSGRHRADLLEWHAARVGAMSAWLLVPPSACTLAALEL